MRCWSSAVVLVSAVNQAGGGERSVRLASFGLTGTVWGNVDP